MRRCLGPSQGVSLSTQARHGRPEPSASLLVPLTLSHRKAVFQSQSAPSQASGVRGGPRVPLMSQPTFKEQGPLRSFQEPTCQQEHPSGGGGSPRPSRPGTTCTPRLQSWRSWAWAWRDPTWAAAGPCSHREQLFSEPREKQPQQRRSWGRPECLGPSVLGFGGVSRATVAPGVKRALPGCCAAVRGRVLAGWVDQRPAGHRPGARPLGRERPRPPSGLQQEQLLSDGPFPALGLGWGRCGSRTCVLICELSVSWPLVRAFPCAPPPAEGCSAPVEASQGPASAPRGSVLGYLMGALAQGQGSPENLTG